MSTIFETNEYRIKGNENLPYDPSPVVEGHTYDLELDGTQLTLTEDSEDKTTVQIPSSLLGTCDTAAATAAKVVTLTDVTDFELTKGTVIVVKFTNTNTARNPTLNVNGTGAKSIYYNTSVVTGSDFSSAGIADRYIAYIYDGTNWVWITWGTDNNTVYSAISKSELTTGTSTINRVVRADYLKSAILDLANPIGTIIHSTTCDTMAKVVEAYGGTTWIQHEGYVLRGATSNVTADDNSNSGTGFGGSDTVTLTGAQSGLKGHGHGFTQPTVNGGATTTGGGGSHAHYVSSNSGTDANREVASEPIHRWTVSSDKNYAFRTINATANWGVTNTVSNHTHSQVAHTHSVSGGAVSDAAASNATSSHSVVQRYKNVYIWERTA